jgi:hypothetical protein
VSHGSNKNKQRRKSMSDQTFTTVADPRDATYSIRRQQQIDELLKLNIQQLDRRLNFMLNSTEAIRDDHNISQKYMGEMIKGASTPDLLRKGILDSTSGTTGNVLIRQDLEPILYALFVKTFPVFERLQKGQANGLVHAFNQITSPDSSAAQSTIISELGTVNYVSSSYQRGTAPIAVFATGRGVGIKELAAVSAGGAPYDPQKTELANGMIKLASDVQYTILQGNASTSSGASASAELGAYNANGFDGFRSILGSVGTYSSNNAIQTDIGSLNMLETLQTVAAKSAQAGGNPSLVLMSMNAKQALDIEQQNNQRYNNDMVEIIPGVRCNRVAWANGELTIVPIPGNTLGTYNRTSDNALVEDIYVLDEMGIFLRWLYSESFTVLQIPTGVDGALSNRFIIFGMYGMEMAAPLYSGKARRLAS